MSSLFLIDNEDRLTELNRMNYESEDLFQKMLAQHPVLLRHAAGSAKKLLLVRREQSVPDENGGAARWSLDHLFLDSEGVPVLVEVKQATDTRARREVVAQMLDYAANGVVYWPIERIINSFCDTVTASGKDPESVLSAFLGAEDAEAFWRSVEANMRAGRIRMLFVADRIPKELARIVEFLNEQMRPAEVLALEVEQFVSSGGVRTLMPRLIGKTERALSAKSAGDTISPISESEWFDKLRQLQGDIAYDGASRLAAALRKIGYQTAISNSQDSLTAGLDRPNGKRVWIFFLSKSSGGAQISLGNLASAPGYRSEEERRNLLAELRGLPAPVKATDKLVGWPSIACTEFVNDVVLEAFIGLAESMKLRISSAD